jgi:hypothetical protein
MKELSGGRPKANEIKLTPHFSQSPKALKNRSSHEGKDLSGGFTNTKATKIAPLFALPALAFSWSPSLLFLHLRILFSLHVFLAHFFLFFLHFFSLLSTTSAH